MQNPMKNSGKIAAVSGVLMLVLTACEGGNTGASSGNCGAARMQELVGKSTFEAVDFIDDSGDDFADIDAYFFAENEAVPDDIAKGSLIIKTDAKRAEVPSDMIGTHVLEVYCSN